MSLMAALFKALFSAATPSSPKTPQTSSINNDSQDEITRKENKPELVHCEEQIPASKNSKSSKSSRSSKSNNNNKGSNNNIRNNKNTRTATSSHHSRQQKKDSTTVAARTNSDTPKTTTRKKSRSKSNQTSATDSTLIPAPNQTPQPTEPIQPTQTTSQPPPPQREKRLTRSATFVQDANSMASINAPTPVLSLPAKLPILVTNDSKDLDDTIIDDSTITTIFPSISEGAMYQASIEKASFRFLNENDDLPRPRAGPEDEEMSDEAFLRRHRPREVKEKRIAKREHEKLSHERFNLRTTVEQLRAGNPKIIGPLLGRTGGFRYTPAEMERVRKRVLAEYEETLARYDYLLERRKPLPSSSTTAAAAATTTTTHTSSDDANNNNNNNIDKKTDFSVPKKLTLKLGPIGNNEKYPNKKPRISGRTVTDTFFKSESDPIRLALFPPIQNDHDNDHHEQRQLKKSPKKNRTLKKYRDNWAWGVQTPDSQLNLEKDFSLVDHNNGYNNEPSHDSMSSSSRLNFSNLIAQRNHSS